MALWVFGRVETTSHITKDVFTGAARNDPRFGSAGSEFTSAVFAVVPVRWNSHKHDVMYGFSEAQIATSSQIGEHQSAPDEFPVCKSIGKLL